MNFVNDSFLLILVLWWILLLTTKHEEFKESTSGAKADRRSASWGGRRPFQAPVLSRRGRGPAMGQPPPSVSQGEPSAVDTLAAERGVTTDLH